MREQSKSFQPGNTCEEESRYSPFFLACEIRSAALLLITLVTYKGQLVWLAMVIARKTASASNWKQKANYEFTKD